MDNKKITLISLTLIIILVIPSISAFSMDSNTNDSCFLGTIKGGVGWQTGGLSGTFIPFASIEIEGIRKKHCNFIGKFIFTGLQFDRTYKIIADANGYESDSTTITLTENNPIEEVYFFLRENDEKNIITSNIKIKYFVRDIIQIIFGKISNPRIEEAGSNKLLVFFAEEVFLIGSTYSYDGPKSITQWIYDEEVKLGWKSEGPDFKGIITKDIIFGRQKYW